MTDGQAAVSVASTLAMAFVSVAAAQNRPPLARASASIREIVRGESIRFVGSSSIDPDSGPSPLSHEWSFGDGDTSSEVDPVHTYRVAGVFAATLTVRDGAAPVLAIGIGARNHTPADERELRRLADDGADRRRITAGAGAVQHHLGDGELALKRLTARLEIDGAGEAALLDIGRRCGSLIDDQIGECPPRRRLRRFLMRARLPDRRRGGLRVAVEADIAALGQNLAVIEIVGGGGRRLVGRGQQRAAVEGKAK